MCSLRTGSDTQKAVNPAHPENANAPQGKEGGSLHTRNLLAEFMHLDSKIAHAWREVE